MKKLYFLLLLVAGVNLTYGQLVINEVLYDPSNNALDGDANGDGIYSQDDDSFIEIYNSSLGDFDIGGYEIWDDTAAGGTIEYRFPMGTIVPAGEAVVVFGGGTPTGNFGSAVVLVGDSGLNFNNSGEVIGIKDTANGSWVLTFDSDALSNNPNESYTRFPDITGNFLQHADTTSVLFSPGTRTDGSNFRELIINEVLYDPSNNALDGDANGDGVYGQDDDSFIEIYNNTGATFDISGYEIWDDTTSGGGSVQYTFPANTTVPAGEVVVVFGGGTPTGTFGTAIVLNAGTGLNFNNSGEVIGIKDSANGPWVYIFNSDELSNNPNESYTRYLDLSNNWIQHADSTTVLFSPGTKVDGTPFRSSTALDENEFDLEFSLYPNPVNDQLFIDSEEKIEMLEIFRIDGSKVMELRNVNRQINVADLSNGIYLLRLRSADKSNTIRFIKQ